MWQGASAICGMSATFQALDDVPARVGVAADRLDDLGDLVDVPRRRGSATSATGSRRPGPRSPLSSAHSSQIVTPRSCSHLTLVSPRRNHSSSAKTERVCTFLVVTSGKPCGEVEPHLVAEDAAGAGAGAVALLRPVVEDPLEEVEVVLHVRQRSRVHRRAPGDAAGDASERRRPEELDRAGGLRGRSRTRPKSAGGGVPHRPARWRAGRTPRRCRASAGTASSPAVGDAP